MTEATLPQLKRFFDETVDFFTSLPHGKEALQSIFSSGVWSAMLEAAKRGNLNIDRLDQVRIALGLKEMMFNLCVFVDYPTEINFEEIHRRVLSSPHEMRRIPGLLDNWYLATRKEHFAGVNLTPRFVTFQFFPLVEMMMDEEISAEMRRRNLRPLCGFEFFSLLITGNVTDTLAKISRLQSRLQSPESQQLLSRLGMDFTVLPYGCAAASSSGRLVQIYVRPDNTPEGRKIVHVPFKERGQLGWGGPDLYVVGVPIIEHEPVEPFTD